MECMCVVDSKHSGVHMCVVDSKHSGVHMCVVDSKHSGVHMCVVDSKLMEFMQQLQVFGEAKFAIANMVGKDRITYFLKLSIRKQLSIV